MIGMRTWDMQGASPQGKGAAESANRMERTRLGNDVGSWSLPGVLFSCQSTCALVLRHDEAGMERRDDGR